MQIDPDPSTRGLHAWTKSVSLFPHSLSKVHSSHPNKISQHHSTKYPHKSPRLLHSIAIKRIGLFLIFANFLKKCRWHCVFAKLLRQPRKLICVFCILLRWTMTFSSQSSALNHHIWRKNYRNTLTDFGSLLEVTKEPKTLLCFRQILLIYKYQYGTRVHANHSRV